VRDLTALVGQLPPAERAALAWAPAAPRDDPKLSRTVLARETSRNGKSLLESIPE
jgi:hypothetical protein